MQDREGGVGGGREGDGGRGGGLGGGEVGHPQERYTEEKFAMNHATICRRRVSLTPCYSSDTWCSCICVCNVAEQFLLAIRRMSSYLTEEYDKSARTSWTSDSRLLDTDFFHEHLVDNKRTTSPKRDNSRSDNSFLSNAH